MRLLISSLQTTDTGALTIDNYVDAPMASRAISTALGNSLLYARRGDPAVGHDSRCRSPGASSRTDMPAKGLIRALILGAFITPPYLGAIGWILLAGPNAGWLNRAWMALTGATAASSTSTASRGLVLVTALYAFPYIFVFTSDALDRVSSEMEEAANILGAGGLRTIFRITLPLVTAGDPRRRDRRVPRYRGAVRHAGDHRAAGAHQRS